MTEASWPSPNHGTPARSVTDAEYAHLAPWASDGVFAGANDVVYANSSGMQVTVRADKYALVRGHAWYSGGTDYNLTIAANSSGSTRVDTVVLRLDRSTWDVTAAVRQGTPGSGAPALQRDTGDTGLWEIPLADVTVINGASTIAAGNVDARTLFQSAGVRVCDVLADIQDVLTAGCLVYERTTGRWIGWTGSAGTALYEDTGWVTQTLTNTAWSQFQNCAARRVNGIVYLRVNAQRKNSTFSKNDSSGSELFTLSGQFRPESDQYGTVVFSGGIGVARVQILQSTGVVSLQHNTTDVAPGRTAAFSMSFPGR